MAFLPRWTARAAPWARTTLATVPRAALLWARAMGSGAGRGVPKPPTPHAIPGVKRIVAVASGKGGVGKSTTTVNLAAALSRSGWRVGVMDADIHGPNVGIMMGLNGKATARVEDDKLVPMERDGIKCMSMSFVVDDDVAMVWRGPMVMSAIDQLLHKSDWGELDCLLVDLPPGTGEAHLQVAQRVPLAGVVVVSTPQDVALMDATRAVVMFRKVHAPVLGVVENMAFFQCGGCGEKHYIFGKSGARLKAAELGVDFLGAVPLDTSIREACDEGHPVALEDATWRTKVYGDIAAAVRAKLEASEDGSGDA